MSISRAGSFGWLEPGGRVVMLVIVGYLREPEFSFAITATDFVAIFFRSVIITNVFRAHPEGIVLNFRFWEQLQKLALTGFDGIVFRPLLDFRNCFLNAFNRIVVEPNHAAHVIFVNRAFLAALIFA
jgi:hypothetical protein